MNQETKTKIKRETKASKYKYAFMNKFDLSSSDFKIKKGSF